MFAAAVMLTGSITANTANALAMLKGYKLIADSGNPNNKARDNKAL